MLRCDQRSADGEPHEKVCYKDLAETFCRSLPAKIATAFSGIAGVNNLKKAVSENQAACETAFNSVIDDWPDTAPPAAGLESVSWAIGNNGSVVNGWPQINNPTVILDATVTGLFLPSNPNDWLTCNSNEGNNGQSFLQIDEDPEIVVELSEGDGVLVGPVYSQQPVTATPIFASHDTQCVDPLCSRLTFSSSGTDWIVHQMSFLASRATSVSDHDSIDFTSEWLHLELSGHVPATATGTDAFKVGAGDAVFQLAGDLEGFAHSVSATNASPIQFVKRGTRWRTGSFAIHYVDSEEKTWSMTVAAAYWE